MNLGDRLKSAREKKGWSQRELARQAHVRYATISELENGKRIAMNTDTAKRLARVLGVGIDYLVGTWDDEDQQQPAGVATVGA
jgi:transcriptional regulator with XRE-family HTH domain